MELSLRRRKKAKFICFYSYGVPKRMMQQEEHELCSHSDLGLNPGSAPPSLCGLGK